MNEDAASVMDVPHQFALRFLAAIGVDAKNSCIKKLAVEAKPYQVEATVVFAVDETILDLLPGLKGPDATDPNEADGWRQPYDLHRPYPQYPLSDKMWRALEQLAQGDVVQGADCEHAARTLRALWWRGLAYLRSLNGEIEYRINAAGRVALEDRDAAD